MHCDCFKKIKDLIFMDDKLLQKQRKLRPLKICIYTVGPCKKNRYAVCGQGAFLFVLKGRRVYSLCFSGT